MLRGTKIRARRQRGKQEWKSSLIVHAKFSIYYWRAIFHVVGIRNKHTHTQALVTIQCSKGMTYSRPISRSSINDRLQILRHAFRISTTQRKKSRNANDRLTIRFLQSQLLETNKSILVIPYTTL